ncbi:hypothetical protein [Candidatus Leptofilum sp.]|uniref:hypothetical protein n=1 Tax=Candidatus Leptofilum sp. TaxID=3241576 RepID=UPI003B593E86
MQRGVSAQSTILEWLIRCYRLLLYAYPTHFRQEYGIWMVQLFRDEVRVILQDGNTAVLLHFLLQTALDLTKTVFIEHIAALFNLHIEGEIMSYHDAVKALSENPAELEQLYQDAVKAGQKKAFQQAIDANFQDAPSNLLLAGWFHRLQFAAKKAKQLIVEWSWVLPLALLNGLLFWWLLQEEQFTMQLVGGPNAPQDFLPIVFLVGAPLTALFLLIYFAHMNKQNWRITAVSATIPLIAAGYVYFIYGRTGVRPFQEQYLTLALIHLPILAWVCVGIFFLFRHRDAKSRLQFLLKSAEVIVVGGIFVGVLFAFFGITIDLFDALNVDFSESLMQLLFGGGLGIVSVIAPAIIYNPTLPPKEQSSFQGFQRLISAVMQVLLPLTFLVLIIYIGFIPANFRAPFDNRDVLITYNVMLFAVVGLLVGATILHPTDSPPERDRWLRRLVLGVTVLTLVVSLYALSAIIFRTINDRLTPNRMAFIGWNVINIGLLALVLAMQWQARANQWLEGLYRTFSLGTAVYTAWVIIIILTTPWFFNVNQGQIETLPLTVQRVVFEEPSPVLLKCHRSPHIYLLDNGEKRWIDNIETFNERGYMWEDVNFVPCEELRAVPDGNTIPANAGSPPQP